MLGAQTDGYMSVKPRSTNPRGITLGHYYERSYGKACLYHMRTTKAQASLHIRAQSD